MRVRAESSIGLANPNGLEECPRRPTLAAPVDIEPVIHLRANASYGIEGRAGILKADGDVLAAVLLKLGDRHLQHVSLSNEELPADGAIRRKQSCDRASKHRLAGAALADEPENLSPLERQRDVGQCGHGLAG
jgi:hypothetical protein